MCIHQPLGIERGVGSGPSCFAGGYSEIQCTTTPEGHWSWTSRAPWFDFV